MPGNDKARVRVLVVIVLLIVAAAALHGYLPGAQAPARVRSTGSLGGLFAVGAMLTVSMAIIAIVVITQQRLPSVSPGTGEAPELAGERRPPTSRMVLVAVGVVIAWLLLAALLTRLNMQPGIEHPPSDSSTQPPRKPESPNVFWLLVGSAGLLIIVSSVGSMIATGRRQRRAIAAQVWSGDEYRPSLATGPESLARAAELGLAEVADLSREPREAMTAGYLAMERELEKAPDAIARNSDDPWEGLARAAETPGNFQAHSVIQLVDLFEEARFSAHVMTEGHRDDAVRALHQVLSELRASS